MKYILPLVLCLLSGCVSTQTMIEPQMFYQAYDPARTNAVAPFFLTLEEAQTFANKMNREQETNYQVSFISP